MEKLLAAYDLGHSALMYRYGRRYAQLFPWDPESGDAVPDCMARLREAIVTLAPALDDSSRLRELLQLRDELPEAAARSYSLSGVSAERASSAAGVNDERRVWNKLVAACKAALSRREFLAPWERLGSACARCWLSLLDDNARHQLPTRFAAIRAAARAVPIGRLRRDEGVVDVTRRLGDVRLGDAEALEIASGRRAACTGVLTVDFICLFVALDERIRTMLKAERDPPDLRILVDPAHSTVSLDGRAFEVNYHQALILQALQAAAGGKVKADRIVQISSPYLDGVRVDREVGKLPKALEQLVGREKGWHNGFWLKGWPKDLSAPIERRSRPRH